MTRASILFEYGRPLEVADVDVLDIDADEVRVRLAATGVCGSDDAMRTSNWGPLPMVLGHEAAGVVEAVGARVDHLRPGDHVVLIATFGCGECFYCRRGQEVICETNKMVPLREARTAGIAFRDLPDDIVAAFRSKLVRDGEPLWRFNWTGTFADTAVVPAHAAIKIDPAVPLDVASLISCAVVTGVGAARADGAITEGDTVAVVGCGGVGLNAVQGARLERAGRIVAVDVIPWKLDLARELGATDLVDAAAEDPVEAVRALTAGRGADVTIEVTHYSHQATGTTTQALEMTRPGGHLILVGGGALQLPLGFIAQLKTVHAMLMGKARARVTYAELARLYLDGELKLDELVSRRLTIEQANDAFEAMQAGAVARSLIVYD